MSPRGFVSGPLIITSALVSLFTRMIELHGSASTVRGVISDAVPVHTESMASSSEARSLQLSSGLFMCIVYRFPSFGGEPGIDVSIRLA